MKFKRLGILLAIIVLAFAFSASSGSILFAMDAKEDASQPGADIRDERPEDDDYYQWRRIDDLEESEEKEVDPDENNRYEEREEKEGEPYYKYPMEEETEEYEKDDSQQ